jgi:hypothetical protein
MPDEPYAAALDVDVRWHPVDADPWLVQSGHSAHLALSSADDPDGLIIFEWIHCVAAVLGGPNDEARNGHPLWNRGLSDCGRAAEVFGSEWIAQLEQRNRVHSQHDPALFAPLRHFILLTKEETFECLADGFDVIEATGAPLDAVAARLGERPRDPPRFTIAEIVAMRKRREGR